MQFFENQILKLRKSVQNYLEEDLNLIQNYVTSLMLNIRTVSGDIFNEYMSFYQRKIMRHILEIMEDDSKSIYDKSTKKMIE